MKSRGNKLSKDKGFATASRKAVSSPFDFTSWRMFVGINFVIATLVCFSFCPSCILSWEGIVSISGDWLYSFLISMLLSAGIAAVLKISDRHFPWLEKPVKRFFFDLVVVSVYSFVVSLALGTLFSLFVWDYFTIYTINWPALVESTKLPTYLALALTVFFTSRSFLEEWKQTAIEAERMKTQQMEGQYMSLKNQLNPHFLFNSLNVLSNLVYESADQANAFIEKLSRIYRYVLEVQNEELISLNQELEFAGSYLELLSIRFGEKFTYSIEVSSTDGLGIPPLSLQLLIENAVKHNKLSVGSPLMISVIQRSDVLLIRNKIQLREISEATSGVGLNNIIERYSYLTSRKVEIIENEYFEVSIPLLKMETEG